MSQAEDPARLLRKQTAHEVTVEDVRQLMGASTPHFALQLRNRIANLIGDLPPDHPARVEGEREIARLERLGVTGETRGASGDPGERALPPLPSTLIDAAPPAE
ncbi:MAG TPA: hypothetical protein VEJ23_05570 [Solirubrobacteraceae bacterium]|nr:hypothetical protein [Solirubrobacteraceae bacterium]